MRKWIFLGLAMGLAAAAQAYEPSPQQRAAMSNEQAANAIVKMCLDQYHSHAPCACPYDVARNGSSCGKRSAYNRPGGYAPLCFATDVTAGMIADFRAGKLVLVGRC
jgi:hypothetical protein